jgi:hypothetical protein
MLRGMTHRDMIVTVTDCHGRDGQGHPLMRVSRVTGRTPAPYDLHIGPISGPDGKPIVNANAGMLHALRSANTTAAKTGPRQGGPQLKPTSTNGGMRPTTSTNWRPGHD